MFVRFASLAAVNKSKRSWDPCEDPEELRILQTHADFFTFRTLPWALWIMAFLTLLLALYLNYYLVFIANKQDCFIVYAGKIEYVTIDKKKGVINYQLINVFCSKIEKINKIDEIIDIEIVLRGVIRRSEDSTRYYIRIRFKENNELIFGECMSVRKASDKFRKCIAILKGIVMPDIIDRGMVTDESKDETTEEKTTFFY